jgi:hypothetical protein
VSGALETIGTSITRTKTVTDANGKESKIVAPRVPGIVETAVVGGVTVGAVSLLALNPVAWPVVGGVVADAGVEGDAAGFVAGVAGVGAFNVALGTVIGGLAGSVGGALLAASVGQRQ